MIVSKGWRQGMGVGMIRCDMAGCMGWGQDGKAFGSGYDSRDVREDLGWKGRA